MTSCQFTCKSEVRGDDLEREFGGYCFRCSSLAGYEKMTSQNVLQPIKCKIRDSDGSPLSKRPKHEFAYTQKWRLSAGQNEMDLLAEMGLGMLDSDEVSDCKSEDEFCRPTSSRTNYEHNDTNPDLIVPGGYLSGSNLSDDSIDSPHNVSRSSCKPEILRSSKTWENFCIYRRTSLLNQDSKDWFNSLSDEIILLIFRWLPKISLTKCALVCKRWHRLACDETLWTRLDCSMKVLGNGALGHIISRQVIILKLAQSEVADPAILPNVKAYNCEFSSKLLYLDLSMASISVNSLALLFEKCSRLRKVSLESCPVNDEVFRQLGRSENLEVLNLTMAEGLTATGIHILLKKCQQLKELNVAWTCLSVEALNKLCTSLPKRLSRLNISGCRKTLNITHIRELVTCCPYLRELDLSDGTGLTNETIKYIIKLKELIFLALSRCYGIQCSILRKLSCMSSLQYLDIHGGHIEQSDLDELQNHLGNGVQLNKFLFSSVARPTVGMKRSSIWGLRVRD